MNRGPPPLFIYLFFFACHFLKPLKFVWVSTKIEISTGEKKEHFVPGKKQGKVALPLLKNTPLKPLPDGSRYCFSHHIGVPSCGEMLFNERRTVPLG